MQEESPITFNDLTERELQIAELFALELLLGIATFPAPVGEGPDPGKHFTATESYWIAYGIESAWGIGRDLVLPLLSAKVRESKQIALNDIATS